MRREMTQTFCSGRLQGHFPFRHFFFFYRSQPAIHLFLLCPHPRADGKKRGHRQEATARTIRLPGSRCALISMQEDLQLRSQRLQLTHFDVSITGLSHA